MCEFCGEENTVEVESEETPTKKDTTYLIAPPMPVEGVAGVGGVGMEASLVIFCIDISGSMCVTAEVSRKRLISCGSSVDLPLCLCFDARYPASLS